MAENHEMTELELYRKELVSKTDTIELLKRDIADMQKQIQSGYIRIKELLEENTKLKEAKEQLEEQLGKK